MHLNQADRELILEEETRLEELRKVFRKTRPSDNREELLDQLFYLREELNCANEDDFSQLAEQMTRLTALLDQQEKRSQQGLDIENPYFARLIAQEGEKKRDFYLGTEVFTHASGIAVIDWKSSPIAALYFRYDEGDEYEEEIGERIIEGKILCKRSLQVLLGELVGIQQGGMQLRKDKELGWQKQILKQRLFKGGSGVASRPERIVTGEFGTGAGQRKHRYLPEITSLIDPKQFNLITAPETGILAIQGTAGSGKTTVALHRVAWLHHQDPARFPAEKMVVLVFNKALATYISKLLPSLGVEGVEIDFYENWAHQIRCKIFGNLLPKALSSETPAAAIRVKKHPALAAALESYLSEIDNRFNQGLATILKGKLALAKLSQMPLIPRLKGVWDWAQGRRSLLGVAWNQSGATRARLEALCQATANPELNPRHLALHFWDEFFSDFTLIQNAFAEVEEIQAGQLTEAMRWIKNQYIKRQNWFEDQRRKVSDSENTVGEERPDLDAEDDPILLYLYHQLTGELPNPKGGKLRYHHIFIDEAQDYAAIELKVMLQVARQPLSITFAGDVNQQMIRYNAFKDWGFLFHLLGQEGQKISSLKVSYRSTFEIMEFAFNLLGELTKENEFAATRHGPAVELFQFRHQGEQIRFLAQALKSMMLKEGNASCALITPDEGSAKALYELLSPMEVPRLRLVEEENFSFTPGIDITEIRQVKGLEFDYVALMDVDVINYPPNSYHRYLLHIGATRAAHQLWLLNYRLKSPILPDHLLEIRP